MVLIGGYFNREVVSLQGGLAQTVQTMTCDKISARLVWQKSVQLQKTVKKKLTCFLLHKCYQESDKRFESSYISISGSKVYYSVVTNTEPHRRAFLAISE